MALKHLKQFEILVQTQVDGESLYRSLNEGEGVFETEDAAVAYMVTEAGKRRTVPRWFVVVPIFRLIDE